MTNDHYISQRAANAILSEIGPYQISSDALQSINHFLDQCLYLVLQKSPSLDLSHLGSQLLTLLPHRLGKNAIVEAELEVKTYSDTNTVDTSLLEGMRSLSDPVDQVWTSLRSQCLKQCALADKTTTRIANDSQVHQQNNLIALSPLVTIFMTTILEHLAEYILTTIAVTAAHQGSDYIRVKEVYWALLQDVQVGDLFKQTEMRSKLEKRVMSSYSSPHYQHPSPEPPVLPRDHPIPELYSELDEDDDDNDEILPSSTSHTARTSSSIKSGQSISSYRPISVLSNGTTATNHSTASSKKGFRFFGKKGKKRSSVASHSTTGTTASNHHQTDRSLTMSPVSDSPSSVQVYDTDTPALDFEDLIRSGNTMKVSLTPNRLRSIEIKSSSTYQPSHSTVKTASPKRIATTIVSPTSNSPRSPPPANAPFENPRAAPKPPIHDQSPKPAAATPPTTPNSSIASRISNARSSPPSALKLVENRRRSENSVDTPSSDVCVMDLPSPPSTMDHHPSLAAFSNRTNQSRFNTAPAFNRPSSIVAKRASGRARPASYHETFALSMEQQQRAPFDTPLTIPIAPSPSTSSPSLSTRTDRSMIRRQRPISQTITEEEDQMTFGDDKNKSVTTLQDKYTTSIDASAQTDPLPGIPSLAELLTSRSLTVPLSVPTLIITKDDDGMGSNDDVGSEQGLVDGDEEWFIQDWDDGSMLTESIV
ncbi:hypothetical protein BC941DRAFT_464939 [Chlamydoabsidia padenii]|nr:hypothetical protein BC941DRAFT_464939 [Chlamydoabsidia padenii]